jgi:hypothetical protein
MPSQINQIPKLQFTDMDPAFQQHYSQTIDALNSLLGFNGEIPLQNHVQMNGFRVQNIGAPASATDAIASAVAESRYSAVALRPQFEAGSSQPLATYRQINNGSQREVQSSFMNDLMSTPPSANTVFPTLTNVGGGVQVSIPSSIFTFADGSTLVLNGRTDILSLPAVYTISSIDCTGTIVTVNLTTTSSITTGQLMTVVGVSPSSFNGTFPVASSTSGGLTLTYQLPLGTLIGSGGQVDLNGVYYYAVRKRQNFMTLFGPFTADTAQNRLQVNFDSFSIVAVVVITNSGGQVLQSGGGGSPIVGSPTAGTFF